MQLEHVARQDKRRRGEGGDDRGLGERSARGKVSPDQKGGGAERKVDSSEDGGVSRSVAVTRAAEQTDASAFA